jgi:hypothetical protein
VIVLLHPAGRRAAVEARAAAGLLAGALGGEAETRPFAAGEREALLRGDGPAGAWGLLPGRDLVAAPAPRAGRLVVLRRRDPRWSLEDLAKRPLARLPAGARVVVPSALGEALLSRARPDLAALRAGAFPAPEETPVLAEGPFDGRPAGDPLDPALFVPAPGTGLEALVAPGDGDAPGPVRGLEDPAARVALDIERAFVAGAGDLPPGASLGALATRTLPILHSLRAVLFRPGAAPRVLRADIPEADARAFARRFGSHLAGTNENQNSA